MGEDCGTRTVRQRRDFDKHVDPEIENAACRRFVAKSAQVMEVIECGRDPRADRAAVVRRQRKAIQIEALFVVPFEHFDDAMPGDMLAEILRNVAETDLTRTRGVADRANGFGCAA